MDSFLSFCFSIFDEKDLISSMITVCGSGEESILLSSSITVLGVGSPRLCFFVCCLCVALACAIIAGSARKQKKFKFAVSSIGEHASLSKVSIIFLMISLHWGWV